MCFVKIFEIVLMLVGVVGFVMYSVMLLYLCMFMMGMYLMLFGFVKYLYLL